MPTRTPVWVKICGIRDPRVARQLAPLEPSAIGLNFYSASPRSMTRDVAAEIIQGLPTAIEPVGLFVNHSLQEIATIARSCRLRAIQLHGDETPRFLAELRRELPEIGLIRAHRLGEEGLGPLNEYLNECRKLGVELRACLIDARVEGVYGGSGKTVCWETLTDWPGDWPPLVLAGGLTADNVAEAIRAVRPWGVDVASGIESAAGRPDLGLIERFIKNARDAMEQAGHTAS